MTNHVLVDSGSASHLLVLDARETPTGDPVRLEGLLRRLRNV